MINIMERCLVINPEVIYIGASLDGFGYCPTKRNYHRLLEIKCPYKWRLVTPRKAAADKGFYCHINENGKIMLKRNSNYYFQVQGQLAVTKKIWCDFVVWTTKCISIEPLKFVSPVHCINHVSHHQEVDSAVAVKRSGFNKP